MGEDESGGGKVKDEKELGEEERDVSSSMAGAVGGRGGRGLCELDNLLGVYASSGEGIGSEGIEEEVGECRLSLLFLIDMGGEEIFTVGGRVGAELE